MFCVTVETHDPLDDNPPQALQTKFWFDSLPELERWVRSYISSPVPYTRVLTLTAGIE